MVEQSPVLVTGASGFVGSHWLQSAPAGQSRSLADQDDEIDIRDAARVKRFLQHVRPANVIHLAALTFVPASFLSERETYDINFLGTLTLLECLRESGFAGRLLYVSSADAYGAVSEARLPTSEDQPLAPRNPYAASKAAAEALCCAWSCQASFKIMRVRPFNHIGPGQHERFVVSDFAKQIIEIKRGMREPVIRTGDLAVTRDFTDVRDVVAAYHMLLASGKNGEVYNVCSGKEVSIYDVLELLLTISGVKAKVERDSERDRSAQQRRSVGSYQKLHSATGWSPKISLERSLTDVLNYWTERLNG